jgi:exodeoxyribonuclease VII small subunit
MTDPASRASEDPASLSSFESSFEELEELVRRLEGGALTLDESLTCYEKGVLALRRCYRILEVAEKRLEMLVREGDGGLATRPIDLADVRGEARGSARLGTNASSAASRTSTAPSTPSPAPAPAPVPPPAPAPAPATSPSKPQKPSSPPAGGSLFDAP